MGKTQLRLTDATAPVTPPATLPPGVTCPADGVHVVACAPSTRHADLGDLDDEATVRR